VIDVTPSRRARPSAGHDAALMGDRAATRGRSAMERGDDHASIRTPISRTGSSPSVPQQHARTERCDQRRAPKSATADRRSRSRSFSANRSSRRSTGSRCRCRAGPGAARSGGSAGQTLAHEESGAAADLATAWVRTHRPTSDRNTPATAHSARRVFHRREPGRIVQSPATVEHVKAAGTPSESQTPRSARRFPGSAKACHRPM